MERIGFVILHYKVVRTTDCCVRSILKLKQREKIHIVVVDNDVSKSEEEREKLREHYSGVRALTVLTNRGNGGFSEANNLGYAYARQVLQCDCILVLNNDIEIPQRDFLERLENGYAREREQGQCHILAPDIIRQGRVKEHQNPMDRNLRTLEQTERTIRGNEAALRHIDLLYPFLALWQQHVRSASLRKKVQESAFYRERQEQIVPFGAFLIFTPEFVSEQEKAFSPETQFFYEEYILALRCRRLGYRIVYDPSMKVLHESGKSTQAAYRTDKARMKFTMEKMLSACRIYRAYLQEDASRKGKRFSPMIGRDGRVRVP